MGNEIQIGLIQPARPTNKSLEDELTEALTELYRRAGKETGYWAHRFLQAVRNNGGRATAKRMLGPRSPAQRAGRRSGAWLKMRVSQGQEFVIGGYTPSTKNFDALIFGYYEGNKLLYAARTRNGFTSAARVYRLFQDLEVPECPFSNLPEARSGRWGQGLTAEKMKQCRWVKPVLVGQFEYLEWTPDNHLRHTRFIGLREDKDPNQVRRE